MTTPVPTDAMYRLLVQSIQDFAIYMLSVDGNVSNWNLGAERAKGYRAEEIVGTHFSRFYTQEDREKDLPNRALATALSDGKFHDEGWRLRKDGSRFWAHVLIEPIFDDGQRHVGFAKITRDRTEYKKQVDELRETKKTLNLALNNMSEGLCLFGPDKRVVLANERFGQILHIPDHLLAPGTSFRSILRQRFNNLVAPEVLEEVVEQELDAHQARFSKPGEILSFEQSWSGRNTAFNTRQLQDGSWVTTVEDITDRKRIEQQIVHLAHHDALTELPNRIAFHEQLESRIRASVPCALLYLDLDRFKPINDSLGHAAGDTVLQTVARRIASLLRKHDVGARLGGDEFAVLLAGCDTARDAEVVADRLVHELQKPIHAGSSEVTIGASIGIALSPQHGVDADTLLRNADLALYSAKQDGRGCHRLYDETLQSTVRHRRELERDLRLALVRNEFSLHYQPILDINRDVVTSFEALLRWTSPTRGNVSPVDFIPFAEEIGLMPEIGDWVLRSACNEAASWESDICVSINLSPTQFRVPDLASRISAILAESGLPANRLELEITETSMIGDIAGARAILTDLRGRGIQIAMDDFGTGYSSLSFLRNFPFTRIKIDRSFIQDLGNKPEATSIIRAVTALCLGLGVAATAEGVETEEQMRILRAEGCAEVQGYLIHRPAAAPEATAWLASYTTHTKVAELALIA